MPMVTGRGNFGGNRDSDNPYQLPEEKSTPQIQEGATATFGGQEYTYGGSGVGWVPVGAAAGETLPSGGINETIGQAPSTAPEPPPPVTGPSPETSQDLRAPAAAGAAPAGGISSFVRPGTLAAVPFRLASASYQPGIQKQSQLIADPSLANLGALGDGEDFRRRTEKAQNFMGTLSSLRGF